MAQESVGRGVNFRRIHKNWKNFTWFLLELPDSCCQCAFIIEVKLSYSTSSDVCIKGLVQPQSAAPWALVLRAQGAEVTCEFTLRGLMGLAFPVDLPACWGAVGPLVFQQSGPGWSGLPGWTLGWARLVLARRED